MPENPTPAPEEFASPKPRLPGDARAAPPALRTEDRAVMGEALAHIVERDGPCLLDLARKTFPNLTEPEERFFGNLGIVDFGGRLPDADEASKTLRADRLAWALLDRCALKLLTPMGVAVGGANIAGELVLDQCQANHRLQLDACRFDKTIHLEDANLALLSLQGSQCQGINADRIRVHAGVLLRRNAQFAGVVRLPGAEIGGNLSCMGSTFLGDGKNALIADGLRATGCVFLSYNATFNGDVRIPGAEIGGNIDCGGSTDAPKSDGKSRACGGAGTGDSRKDDGIHIQGKLDFTNANVAGKLILKDYNATASCSLCLSHARVGVLLDDGTSWPEKGRLWLDGFRYDRLDKDAEQNLNRRLEWLARHNLEAGFNPQPYEQLARAYREMGCELEARDVLIDKHWKWLRYSWRNPPDFGWRSGCVFNWLRALGSWCIFRAGKGLACLFGLVCDFGYKPWKAVIWWLGLWGATWAAADWMAAQEWLVPTKEHAKAIGFIAPGYAFDLLTPILNLGFLGDWTPANVQAAFALIGLGSLGYILVALFAGAVTGLIRK